MAKIKVLESMIRIYADLIRKEIRSIDSLPQEYQEPVKEYIKNNPSGL